MPFDGFGNFLRLYSWVVDATNSVKIRADRHDDEDNNFTAGLSNCITKDGQTAVTQNIPLNSRRLVSVADPVNPQDAATKHYADTKMALDGSVPITGDVVIRNDDPSLTLDGSNVFKNSIYGDKGGKHRWEIILGNAVPEGALDGNANSGSDFELVNYADDGTQIGDVLYIKRENGLLLVKADPTSALGVATKQYTDKMLPLAGGTITGNLRVNGELLATQGLVRFTTSGGPGYISWTGGANYVLGGGGTIWHSGNFTPSTVAAIVTALRLAWVGNVTLLYNDTQQDPAVGGVVTGWYSQSVGHSIYSLTMRVIQTQTTPGAWYSASYLG